MAVVRVLAAVLDRLVNANSHLARADPGQVTKFHALKAPGIGIMQYLERIHKYASCSTECFILALIYIDRLIQRNNFLLTELNVHRVVITAVLLAAKFFDDAYYNNAYYAKVGGVLVSEMNSLEVEFLFRINFSLKVSPELFQKYHAELVSHAVGAGLEQPTQPEPSQMLPVEQPFYNASQNVPTVATSTLVSAAAASCVVSQQHSQVNTAPGTMQNGEIDDNYERVQGQYTAICSMQQVAQQITPSPPPHPSTHPHETMVCQDDVVTSHLSVAPATAPATMLMSSAVPPAPIPVEGLAPHLQAPPLQRHHSLPPLGGYPISSSNTKPCLPLNTQLIAPTTVSANVVEVALQNRNLTSHTNHTISTSAAPLSPAEETENFVMVDNSDYQREHQFVAHYQHSGLIHHRHDEPQIAVTSNVPSMGVYNNGRKLSGLSYHAQMGTSPAHIEPLSHTNQHFAGTTAPQLGIAGAGRAFA
eukprot:CAMPEP_0185734084 /NCGR_PEP_ID=MMETSP1171-20130828/21364_1 /TAXON_ID=374046 /ORGANISM="Helicotheca tamensis, Strain CCMP826" /LENGTH=474 /DNA_ID=CAMNT_0028403977 /DNA_START=450 /DNA_END=1874 /DNA_ORIENTATION=+